MVVLPGNSDPDHFFLTGAIRLFLQTMRKSSAASRQKIRVRTHLRIHDPADDGGDGGWLVERTTSARLSRASRAGAQRGSLLPQSHPRAHRLL